MPKICPVCRGFDTHINIPGEWRGWEKMDGELEHDVNVPFRCNSCGYEWQQVLHGRRNIKQGETGE